MYLRRFPLLTKEEIENSPSRKDDVTAPMEELRRRNASLAIWATAQRYQMSAGTAAIASTFYARFYARKSLKRNQPFVISVAALCLAGKVNDEPRPFKNLTVEMFKQWYRAGDNPEVKAKLYDVIWLEGMYSAVLNAEWCLMHALDFDFNVDLVHSEVAKALKLPSLEQVKDVPKLQQAVVSCCNDVMKKDGTLVLQYPVWELALVIIDFMAQRFHSMDDTRPLPNPDAEGRPWYVGAGLSVEHCKEISLRLSNMYSQAKKAQKAGQERVAPLSALDAGYSQGTSLTPPPPLGAPTEIKLRSSPLQSTADMPLHGDVPVQGSPKRMRLDDDGSWKEGKPSAVGAQAPPPAASPESSEPEEGEIL